MFSDEGKRQGSPPSLERTVESSSGQDIPARPCLERLADAYFAPKSFERGGKIYEYLGVKYVKRAVRALTPGRRREDELSGSNYFIGSDLSSASLRRFEKATRRNEGIHLAGALLLGAVGGFFLLAGGHHAYDLAGVESVAAAVLTQLPLIALQRYHRARIYGVLEKRERAAGPAVIP